MKESMHENITETELREVAEQIAGEVRPGSVVALTGELGVGKTVFAKAMARALGITETVASPTFMLLKEYESGCLPLYHFDAYRMQQSGEDELLGLTEYFFGCGVSVVEWANNIRAYIPAGAIWINIIYGDAPDTLTLTIGGDYAE